MSLMGFRTHEHCIIFGKLIESLVYQSLFQVVFLLKKVVRFLFFNSARVTGEGPYRNQLLQ